MARPKNQKAINKPVKEEVLFKPAEDEGVSVPSEIVAEPTEEIPVSLVINDEPVNNAPIKTVTEPLSEVICEPIDYEKLADLMIPSETISETISELKKEAEFKYLSRPSLTRIALSKLRTRRMTTYSNSGTMVKSNFKIR